MKSFKLPQSLLLGTATAATQIEGGDKNSNWYYWSLAGKINNNESSIVAANHYNRYLEDIELMDNLNQEIYRMSIEWSRIEPSRDEWSEEGVAHYRDELTQLLKCNIKPLVTLHHFSCPQWFQEIGGFLSDEAVALFLRFTEKVVVELGDLIEEYCTINEPNVFVNDTYMDGKYPPGEYNNIRHYFKASKNLIIAHVEAYKLIHKLREQRGYTNTKVGFAHHIAYFDLKTKNPLTKLSKKMMDYSFHTMFLKGMVEGKLVFPLGSKVIDKGIFCDFLGVNYYSRHLIHSSLNPATLFGEVKVEANLADDKLNDLGWEIYPEGLFYVCEEIYNKYQLPIYITENGMPDSKDTKRAKFIYDHLYQVKSLIDKGIKVERYYHWSFMDNLEWNDGYGPRFGLVEVNYQTLERKVRNSGHFYAKICENKVVTEEMIEEYINKSGDNL